MSEENAPIKVFINSGSAYDAHFRNEQLTREYQIAIESMGILREKLAHCVRTENVNHYVKCKDLREKYFALCNDRYHGMIFPEGYQPVNRNVPGLIPPKK